jgi:hypothetical protein
MTGQRNNYAQPDGPRELKHRIFGLVQRRLVERSDSLQLFYARWHGSAAGIEGWFKVEFVAAIAPDVASVGTGGSGGRGRRGRTYADLVLKTQDGAEHQIETKAWGSNWYGERDALRKYAGRLLAFLAPSKAPLPTRHRQNIEVLDKNLLLAPICEVQDAEGKQRTFYFGIADLRDDAAAHRKSD